MALNRLKSLILNERNKDKVLIPTQWHQSLLAHLAPLENDSLVICTASWYPLTGRYGGRYPAGIYAGIPGRVRDHIFSCAWNYAPLGAWVLVFCPLTSRSVLVQVVDRIGEPEYADRIDLSVVAFEALGLDRRMGLAQVVVFAGDYLTK